MRYETGGQAFPGQVSAGYDPREGKEWNEGMSLRDYFAAAAMQGIACREQYYGTIGGPVQPVDGRRQASIPSGRRDAGRKGEVMELFQLIKNRPHVRVGSEFVPLMDVVGLLDNLIDWEVVQPGETARHALARVNLDWHRTGKLPKGETA